MPTSWPSTALDAAQRAFELLTCPPAPLAFDCRGVAGLPQRVLPLDELQTVLVATATPRLARDAVWREVVVRARRDGQAWVIAAVGLAMPGLRHCSQRLACGWRGDASEWDAELLTGFVARLQTVDVDDARICGRLLDAAQRAGRRARQEACAYVDAEDPDTISLEEMAPLPPRQPWDHPDWVLGRAQYAAVISPEERLLIGATRLGQVPLRRIADELGISVELATKWRRAGEHRVREAINDGELEWITLLAQAAALRQAHRHTEPVRVPARAVVRAQTRHHAARRGQPTPVAGTPG